MENLTDSQLITLYIDGNSKAFDGLIARYGKTLYRFAYTIFSNPDDAHDCVQESFIKIWKHIKKFDRSKSFRTWIFTITRRTALDILRKRKTVHFSSMDNDEEGITFAENIADEELIPDQVFEQSEGVELVGSLLKKLHPDIRAILLLYHTEDMTFEQISEILEKPMNTIKSQYRRALIKMRGDLMHQNYKM